MATPDRDQEGAGAAPASPSSEEVKGVDHLYQLKPGDFVAARDELAKRLKAEGDRHASAEVKRLRRPTVVAWALNQVARSRPDDVAALIEAGAEVRRAQADALSGGHGDELREASRRRQDIVSTLLRATVEMAGPTHHDAAVATINAASLDTEVGARLQQGHLAQELSAPSGFDGIGMPEPPAPAPSPAPPQPAPARRRELNRRRGEMERAEVVLTEAEGE